MRIIIAKCSVVYTGRGDTKMNPAVRAIILKDDGAISIHNDAGNKPLNYMGKGNVFSEVIVDETLIWHFDTRKENLTIEMHEIVSDSGYVELDLDDEGLIRDGTEKHLQEWLSDNLHTLGDSYTLVGREFQTGAGAVDLFVKHADGTYFCVEIKRTALLSAVDQVNRYVKALRETEEYENENIVGMVAALDIRPSTRKQAEKRGVQCVVIDNNWREQRDASTKNGLTSSTESGKIGNNDLTPFIQENHGPQ